MLDADQCDALRDIINQMIRMDESVGFLCQNPESLYAFVEYFGFFNKNIKPNPRKCYVPYNTITLNEKGRIRPCFYLEEETGMTVDYIKFNHSKFYEPSNTLMCNFIVFVKDDSEFNPNEEIDSYAWFTKEEALVNIKKGTAEYFLKHYLGVE